MEKAAPELWVRDREREGMGEEAEHAGLGSGLGRRDGGGPGIRNRAPGGKEQVLAVSKASGPDVSARA